MILFETKPCFWSLVTSDQPYQSRCGAVGEDQDTLVLKKSQEPVIKKTNKEKLLMRRLFDKHADLMDN